MVISNVAVKYNDKSPLDGAFAYLQRYAQRTDIENGVIKINTSSDLDGVSYRSIPIVNKDLGSTYWCSENNFGNWYEVDFLQNKFYLQGYFIYLPFISYLSDWLVLGSNDGIKYDVVDNVSGMAKPTSKNNYFSCKYPKLRKSFKIKANGKRFDDNYYLCFNRLELYGRFMQTMPNFSCRSLHDNHFSFVFYCIVLCCYS